MEKDITIGYVCEANPFEDRRAWSGTLYKIREGIEKAGFRVVWIPFDEHTPMARFFEKLRWKLYDLTGRRQILGGVHFLPELVAYTRSIKRDATFQQCDVLFFPRAGQVGLYLRTSKPIIYYADATAFSMVDYYWHNCHPWSVKMACRIDKKASRKAALNLRSSQWSADSVVDDCGCPPARCKVLEYGANIDDKDIVPNTPYQSGPFHVLFSGVDWERKGGDVAVEAVRLLRAKGIDARLHIVGIRELPAHCRQADFIVDHGFLNKNEADAYRRYIEIFRGCHAFLLPTQAECSATVYCEAAGFGVPAYTYATGGTQNYVVNGVNGYALPPTDGPQAFAERMYKDITEQHLDALHRGAVQLYHEKLSWDAWARRFRDIMNSTTLK